MSRQVVLARPHPFIRQPMTETLAGLGFEPVASASGTPAGVVVSTSVNSEAGAFDEVLADVKARYGNAPLVIATLMKPEVAGRSLAKTIARVFPGRAVSFLNDYRKGNVLIVRPDDLKADGARDVFRKHLS